MRPARAYIYLAAGTHNLTIKSYNNAWEPANLRGTTITLDGTISPSTPPTISLTTYTGSNVTNATFDWPVNLYLKTVAVSRTDTTTIISPQVLIPNGFVITCTINVPTYINNNFWMRGGTPTFTSIVQIAKNGKLFVNSTAAAVNAHAGYLTLAGGELNILPGETLTYARSNQCLG